MSAPVLRRNGVGEYRSGQVCNNRAFPALAGIQDPLNTVSPADYFCGNPLKPWWE